MMNVFDHPISWTELESFLGEPFDEMIKFVVDIEKEILALGGELHADAESLLLTHGSSQRNLWGGNLYPDSSTRSWKEEYSALINIRPSQGNNAMEIKDENVTKQIKGILQRLLP